VHNAPGDLILDILVSHALLVTLMPPTKVGLLERVVGSLWPAANVIAGRGIAILDPIEEQEIGECLDSFEGQDLDLEIVGMVQAKVRGDIIEEVSSDSDSDEPEVVPPSLKEMIEVSRTLFTFVDTSPEVHGLSTCLTPKSQNSGRPFSHSH